MAALVRLESDFVVADRAAVVVAARQHCVITIEQLHEAGHTRASIRHRVASGWMRSKHRGVYHLGPLEPPLARAMAAVLALGDGALLSHYPAAVLHGLRPAPAKELHVTVIGRAPRGPRGIQVHRINRLHPTDAIRCHAVPVTSPERTLLDIATQVSARDLDRAVNEARVLRLVTDHSLHAQFARYPNHRGTSALKQATRSTPAFTRTEAERRMLELIRAARLPEPETNAHVNGWEVDFLWRKLRLVVEVDGYAVHSTRAAFERDRRRDADHTAAGYRVIRISWDQLTGEPTVVVALLARATAA